MIIYSCNLVKQLNNVPLFRRALLTWRGRLAQVLSEINGPKIYNLHSTTEDVLRPYDGDDLFKFSELVKNLENGTDAAKAYLATSSWVKQEKFKGRRSIFNIAANFGGVSSSYCGWGFNSYWDTQVPQANGSMFTIHRPPAQAVLIPRPGSSENLQVKPFFSLPTSRLFGIGIDLNNLVAEENGISPSAFVDKFISDTPLKGYYTDNTPAQRIVTVRDWLLAEAFPATTLPMGVKKSGRIDDEQEIDMSTTLKTDENLWPREDPKLGRPWFHSDYKKIPYQHVFTFYKKITQTIYN